jgi:hypothetical protein
MTPEDIHRIADRLQPALRKAFIEAVEALRAAVPVNEIADILEAAGDISALLSEIRLTADELKPIRDLLEEAAQKAARVSAAEFGLDFTLVNPRAVRWATDHSSTLIQGIDLETRTAIRRVITQGQAEGVNVREQAKLIRELIGLTERDALAVDRMWRGALGEGESQAMRSATRMADRMLNRRAENIARTETMTSANMGTRLSALEAQDQGLLPQSAETIWIVTDDERLCPECEPMDGQVVDLGAPFSSTERRTASGELEPIPETTTLTPPLHASCRCTLGIVV